MKDNVNKDRPIQKNVEEFLQVFRKGEEFTQELLQENERLRFKVAELEGSVKRSVDEKRIHHYEERIRLLEESWRS